MSDRRPLLRDLIRAFFADYLRLVEPDSAVQMCLEQITFPRPEKLPECDEDECRDIGVVAEVPSRLGEIVTVLAQIEPEALDPLEIARRLGRYLTALELRYGQPVLLSVVYLQGGCPGVHLESGIIGELCGIELVRIYYTTFALEDAPAEYFLERPEPLAWALSALMLPTRRTPEEHRTACLARISAAPVDEERRLLLRRSAEAFLLPAGGETVREQDGREVA